MANEQHFPDADEASGSSGAVPPPDTGFTEVSADPDKPREYETGKVEADRAAGRGSPATAKIIGVALAVLLIAVLVVAAVWIL